MPTDPRDPVDACADLDHVAIEAAEEGHVVPSDKAQSNARRLLYAMYRIAPQRFEVYPMPHGEVAISDRHIQEQQAQMLADRSRWCPNPLAPWRQPSRHSSRRSSGEKARKPRLITTSSAAMPPSAHCAPTASAMSPMANAPRDIRLICVM